MYTIAMNTTEQILVIILASTLAIFLILAIVATIKVIQILNHLKVITEKAEQLVDKAEAVGEFFQKTAGPVALGKLISNIVGSVLHHDKQHKRRDRDG